MWQDLTGQEFSTAIDNAYSRTVHWRQNIFKIPSRACGKRFVGELARLFEAFTNESAYEAFAIKADMTLPALVLQKSNANPRLVFRFPASSDYWSFGEGDRLLSSSTKGRQSREFYTCHIREGIAKRKPSGHASLRS